MAKKVKQTGKNTLILLMICVVVFMAYIVYKTFGNQIVELFHLLEHGDQEELKAYLEAQSTAGGFVVCADRYGMIPFGTPGTIHAIATTKI